MLDNSYVKNKILARINSKAKEGEVVVSEDMMPAITELIDSINLNISPSHSENFEECVVGWVTFCNIVFDLIGEKLEMTKENFKKFYYANKEVISKPLSQKTDYVEITETIKHEPEEEKKLRLLMLCDDEEFELPEDDLDVEGLRRMGYVSALDTELDGEELNIKRSSLPILRLKIGDEIISPFSGTNYIYRVSENTFLDIDTEQEFLVFFD